MTGIPELSELETIVRASRFMMITPISPPKQAWLRAFPGLDPECLLASRRLCCSRRWREHGDGTDDPGRNPYIRCVPGPDPTTCCQPDQLWWTSQESTTTLAVECGTGKSATQFRPVAQPNIVMFGSGSGKTAGTCEDGIRHLPCASSTPNPPHRGGVPVPLPRLNGNPPQRDSAWTTDSQSSSTCRTRSCTDPVLVITRSAC